MERLQAVAYVYFFLRPAGSRLPAVLWANRAEAVRL